jgi:hypothetical protein
MKRRVLKQFIAACTLFICTIQVNGQLNKTDPFQDNYLLGNSSELLLIRSAEDTIEFTIVDANGNVNDGGLTQQSSWLEVNEWAAAGEKSPISIISGNFNDDKYTDVVASWEAPDSSVVLFIPVIDPATLSITGASRQRINNEGFPKMYRRMFSLPRLISLGKGQLDNDREQEIILAYMAETTHPEGGPVMLVVYDLDKTTGTLEVKDSMSTVMLYPEMNDAPNGLKRGSLFDIATGDFNQDGIDEIVLTAVIPLQDADNDYGWKLDAFIYEFNDNQMSLSAKTSTPLFSQPSNSSDYFNRLGIITGNFDNDFLNDIAITYQLVETGNGDSEIYLQALTAHADSFKRIGLPERVDGSNGNNGWPMTIKSGDFNADGRDEIHLAARYRLRAYNVDEDLNIDNGLDFFSVSLSTEDHYNNSETFAVTDMDIADSDTLRQEIVIIDNNGLEVYQNKNGNIDSYNPLAFMDLKANAMVSADLDGDALRLGPPKRQTRTEIVQPIMVLSSPPIHIDVFDDEVFDLQDCYPINEVTPFSRCNTSFVSFTSIEGSTIESSTQVKSSWNTSKSISASLGLGGNKGVLSAKINGSLEQRYGEGFSKTQGSTQEFELSAKSESREDDLIYCTVSSFELLEYPVYAEDTLYGHVLAVIPGETNEAWFPGRSSIANSFHMNHEVGNIMSYPKTTELPPGAKPFGVGGYDGGSDTWTVSPSTVQNWNLKFGSETIQERESFHSTSLTRKIDAEVGAKFKFVNASVKGAYQDKSFNKTINTHKTTIKESSEIEVSIGLINSSFVGTKTYDVTPFMYWDASGTLILDYAVSPDFSGGVPSWWEEKYGQFPDLTFNLPWRHQFSKGLSGSDDDLQTKQTRDIVISPLDPQPGDTATIFVRVQNYSNVDQVGTTVKFFLGDPDNGGELIVNDDGISEVVLEQVNAREPVVARLENWIVPTSVENHSMVFAVVDQENLVEEVHENNNKAWNLINLDFGNPTSTDDFKYEGTEFTRENRIALFPNPVRDAATFRFAVEEETNIELSLYDLNGRLIKNLYTGHKTPGVYFQTVYTSDLNEGIYVYMFSAGGHQETGKFIVIK